MYVYCYVNIHRLVPVYRQVCVFPKRLESFDGISRMDIKRLVRLLEHATILSLDIYAPCKGPKWMKIIGYSEEMYLEALEQCGISRSVFHPLNHAMPLKQSKMRTAGRRVCRGCGSASSGANAWYLDPYATEEKPVYNCSACYWYRARDSSDRPSTLFNRFRARLTAGPCKSCEVTESVLWCWHGEDKDRVI